MRNNFAVASSPHLRSKATTQRIMLEVCLALAPAGIAGVILFGWRAALLIAVCVTTCIVSELLWQLVTRQKVTVNDFSAVVTGLLLAYNLPASAPVWMAVIGSVLAIILVKQLFGGIGSNFMNPALTARAVLFISWSALMSAADPAPISAIYDPIANFVGKLGAGGIDVLSGATPLNALNAGSTEGLSLMSLLMGTHGGMLGETCAIALIIGGVYLCIRGIADWRIPAAFIGTVFVCYFFMGGAEMALYQLLSGGLLLGAFFMATDYATSPITGLGRVIFGVGCGLLLFVIRAFANYPEGCSFAILFMNVATPMIDRFTMPRPFGEVKKHG
ncbi:MAG: RnfABCDGE type electron transport complex subunit D [Clostridia bacterium]|nr:RnfABCDGE type electron transport complex subunit D [Clostridia bacterium]